MRLLYWLLDLLFPPKCALCGKLLTRQETDFCTHCRVDAPIFPALPGNTHPSGKSRLQFLDSFTAVWYYKENVRQGIHRLKFQGARHLARPYSTVLAMKLLQTHPEGFDVITWVPVSRRRRRSRGYDQSQMLAQGLQKELGIPAVALLEKTRHNTAQSTLPPEKRRANVLGAYRCRKDVSPAGKRILLVDDVFTTGATAEECARVLLTAGAKEVHGAAVAAAQKE